MATEIVTPYPDFWWQRPLEPMRFGDSLIEQRLGAIEQQLSRIEEMISKALGPAKEG